MKVLVMAGGTGGHVFPALAVAGGLRNRGADVVWMGTRQGIEARLVPEAGYPIEWISVSGVRGKGLAALLMAPLRILRALAESLRIMRRQQPALVIGMGGFASGPGGLAAWLSGRPLLIHEQNAAAGLTNRLLARLARRVLEAFPDTFPGNIGADCVGNPVRPELLAIEPPEQRLAGRSERLRILVVGGSQGALALNETVPAALQLMDADDRPDVRHQAGRTIKTAEQAYAGYPSSRLRLEPFIDDMADAYRWADLVICRSGALTVAELAASGSASILVPFPYAVDDHQTLNGRWLSDAEAAVLIPQEKLTARRLADEIEQLAGDRGRIVSMASAARTRAWPEALDRIVEQCFVLSQAGEAGS